MNKKNNNNQLEDVVVSSSFVSGEQHSARTSSESGASRFQEVVESANAGASPNAEDSREGNRKEPCRTSSESEGSIGRTESNSTSGQKDSAPPRPVSPQNTSSSQETSLDAPVKSSAPAKVESDTASVKDLVDALELPKRREFLGMCGWLEQNGRQEDEIRSLFTAAIIKLVANTEVEVLRDAIAATQQKISSIQNLPGYFRKAITEKYKPTKVKAAAPVRERGAGDPPVYADDVDKSKPLWFLGENEWAELKKWGWETEEEFQILVHYLHEYQCETVRISSIRSQFVDVERLRAKRAKEAKATEAN